LQLSTNGKGLGGLSLPGEKRSQKEKVGSPQPRRRMGGGWRLPAFLEGGSTIISKRRRFMNLRGFLSWKMGRGGTHLNVTLKLKRGEGKEGIPQSLQIL